MWCGNNAGDDELLNQKTQFILIISLIVVGGGVFLFLFNQYAQDFSNTEKSKINKYDCSELMFFIKNAETTDLYHNYAIDRLHMLHCLGEND